jgi:hypothetical protein
MKELASQPLFPPISTPTLHVCGAAINAANLQRRGWKPKGVRRLPSELKRLFLAVSHLPTRKGSSLAIHAAGWTAGLQHIPQAQV